ncbi:integral membrane PTH11 [Fusarium albosuccineum]|uniref:Integral membrane PTH11 n=1 Tax=Fusarium albosuccineum TaxID=1237068 RepID=A0A8H4P4V0_9HYPO|nr:integral membrane PTH11 [Fusarium albosuccineum]
MANSIVQSFTIEAFTLLAMGICFILFRTYARIAQVGVQNLAADDYIMPLVIIPYTIETTLAYLTGAQFHGLSNSHMTPAEREALSPDSAEYHWRIAGSRIQIAGWFMYSTVLWLIKSSLCCFYLRLTAGLWAFKTRIYTGFCIIAATYIIGLVALFSGGVFVMVAGLLRCILIVKNPATGAQQSAAWAVRESFVALITSNLPMTWGWMRQKLKPVLGSWLSSSGSNPQRVGPEPGSIMLVDHGDHCDRRSYHGESTNQAAENRGLNQSDGTFPIHHGQEGFREITPNGQPQCGIRKEAEFA